MLRSMRHNDDVGGDILQIYDFNDLSKDDDR